MPLDYEQIYQDSLDQPEAVGAIKEPGIDYESIYQQGAIEPIPTPIIG